MNDFAYFLKKKRLLPSILFLCTFALPLVGPTKFTVLIILLIMAWFVDEKPYLHVAVFFSKLKSPLFIVPFLFLLLQFVAVFYSQNQDAGFRYLERQLPLIIFPLIFLTSSNLSTKDILLSFGFYIVGMVLSVFISFGYALEQNQALNSLEAIDYSLFTYHNLAGPIVQHAVYFGAMIAMAVILVLHLTFVASWRWTKRLAVLLVPFFLFTLLLLQGRIIVLSLLLMPFFLLLLYLTQRESSGFKKAAKFSVPALLMLVIGVVAVYSFDSQRARYSQLIDFDASNLIGSTRENGVSQRLFFWINGWSAIQERPLFGYGTGDGFLALKYQFEKRLEDPNVTEPARRALMNIIELKLNVHNHYLHVWLTTGIIGLVIFVLLLVYPAWYFWKAKLYSGLAFIFIYGSFFITETVFHWHFGVLPFSLFYAQFIYLAKLQIVKNNAIHTQK